MDPVAPPPPWEAGRQGILNALEAQMPEHTFGQPVPVVARIVWEHDGEELIETVALGWTGQHAYIRLPDPRYRFTAVWLDASDVKRINLPSRRTRTVAALVDVPPGVAVWIEVRRIRVGPG